MKQDSNTLDDEGKVTVKVPHGVTFRPSPTHSDDRGSVCEIYDTRWNWHPDPLVFSYFFTIRPNKAKGWGLHKKHEDRYFVATGEIIVVLYDDRVDSPTRGMVSQVHLSEWNRQLMNIPVGVWHADFNPGSKDALVVNFPTICYDHKDPDKYRLPLDTEEIPYKFPPGITGW